MKLGGRSERTPERFATLIVGMSAAALVRSAFTDASREMKPAAGQGERDGYRPVKPFGLGKAKLDGSPQIQLPAQINPRGDAGAAKSSVHFESDGHALSVAVPCDRRDLNRL